MIGLLLCLIGLHRCYSYDKRVGNVVRIWTFCHRPDCQYIAVRKARP